MHRKSDERILQHKAFAFKAEKVSDDGTFNGYASVFDVMDSYREIVAPGAFAESLKEIKRSGDPLPMLWQHRSAEPIGGYDTLAEDGRGLACEGWLMIKEIERAREAHALMKRRVVKGLSIGYYVLEDSYNEKDRIRTLKRLDLVEISPVTFGANPEALIDEVKAAARLKTIREFEEFLRDAGGFSVQRAKAIASAGWSAVDEARDESDEALRKTLEAFASFQL